MDKKEAFERLKSLLTDIHSLEGLPCDNQRYILWLNEFKTIIKNKFDQDDYNTFESVQPLDFLDDIGIENLEQSVDYPKKLKGYETALKSIIRRYEIFGIDENPATDEKKSIYQKFWGGCKDFVATIIAKFMAEKTK